MRLERVRPTVLQVTLHAHELASLVAAARHVVENAPPGVPEEARQQLKTLLENYDEQVRRLPAHSGPEHGA